MQSLLLRVKLLAWCEYGQQTEKTKQQWSSVWNFFFFFPDWQKFIPDHRKSWFIKAKEKIGYRNCQEQVISSPLNPIGAVNHYFESFLIKESSQKKHISQDSTFGFVIKEGHLGLW